MDYDLEPDEVGIAQLLVELFPALFLEFRDVFRIALHEAAAHDAVVVRTQFPGDCQPIKFTANDFGSPILLFDSYGKVTGCKEKDNGSSYLMIPAVNLKARVFSDCKTTKFITTESSAKVSWATFISCKSMETLKLGSGNEVLPRQLCEGCSALRCVELPNDVIRIDDRAFYGCKNLEQINIPDSVLYINPTAFSGCTKLPPDTLERIRALSD